jgi:hypothetical protein
VLNLLYHTTGKIDINVVLSVAGFLRRTVVEEGESNRGMNKTA